MSLLKRGDGSIEARKAATPAVLLTGIVIGLLVAGLLVPVIAGDPGATRTVAASGPLATASAAGQDDAAAGEASGGSDPAATGAPSASTSDARTRTSPPAGTPGGVGSSGTLPPTPGVPGTVAGRKVYDQGITDRSIKVGFLLYDLAGAGRAGFTQTGLDPRQQRAAFEAYIDDVNRRGGINGRKIEPVFKTFDLLSEDGQRSVCLSMIEDEKVFVSIGQFFFRSAYLCATR